MDKRHKAVLVGCGAIGTGFERPSNGFIYDHLNAYKALSDRVEVVALVDKDVNRLVSAGKKINCAYLPTIEDAIKRTGATIVSVCVPPDAQLEILQDPAMEKVKGIWCEKPYRGGVMEGVKVQIDYIRRYEPVHKMIADSQARRDPNDVIALHVSAKSDESTVCHFADLARFWNIPIEKVSYTPTDGTSYLHNEYELILKDEKIIFRQGGAQVVMLAPSDSAIWAGHKVCAPSEKLDWKPDFMVNALSNLLDAVEGKEDLICPAEEAVKTAKATEELMRRIHGKSM